MNATRQALIDSMKELLWLRGYDATSPNQVLDHCGAGKGSFYHHFKGKKALAIEAMNARVDELIADFDLIFGSDLPWLNKFQQYLLQPRTGIKGCPMGRLVSDPSISDNELRTPIDRYFKHLLMHMSMTLSQAQQAEQLDENTSPVILAETVVSAIQGGFIISRALHDDQSVNSACLGVFSLLKGLARQAEPMAVAG